MSLLAHSHLGGEHHCQILQKKNPHPHHPPGRKDQTTAEMSATHSTGCGTTTVMLSLPETQTRSQTGMGRTRKQRQYQGTLGQGLGCCGEQKRALAEQVKISDRLCCPSMSCILQQCPIHVVIRGTRKLNFWQTCRTGKKKIQMYILLASQNRHFYLITPTH